MTRPPTLWIQLCYPYRLCCLLCCVVLSDAFAVSVACGHPTTKFGRIRDHVSPTRHALLAAREPLQGLTLGIPSTDTPWAPRRRSTQSPHYITRTEALRGAANRVLFSQFYILLYLGMALLSSVRALCLRFHGERSGLTSPMVLEPKSAWRRSSSRRRPGVRPCPSTSWTLSSTRA